MQNTCLVLDIGIGNKQEHIENWFSLKGEIVGIDLRKNHKPSVVCDAQNLPFQNAVFAKASASEILEHLPNPTKALKEWNRVLKCEANLYLTVPNGLWFPIIVNSMRQKLNSLEPEHYNTFIYAELQKLLRLSGFLPLQTRFFTRYIQKGLLPKLAYALRAVFPSLMEMNVMMIAEKMDGTQCGCSLS